jgi:hypothetical protein
MVERKTLNTQKRRERIMPNIDTSTIEGFDGMTDAQKVDALLKVEIPDRVDLKQYVDKSLFDKKLSELADVSKQLKAKQTDDEAEKSEQAKAMQELQGKYNDLLKNSTIASHTARYMAMPGYDENLAHETAEALFNGEMDKVFENQKKANEAYKKQVEADAMRGMKKPSGGDDGNDDDEAMKMAKRLGAQRAKANETARNGLKNYM